MRLAFDNWSDVGNQTHEVVALDESTEYTANFNTQYYLAVNEGELEDILQEAVETFGSGWYNEGETAELWLSRDTVWKVEGESNLRYSQEFLGWEPAIPGYTGETSYAEITMDGTKTETATWSEVEISDEVGIEDANNEQFTLHQNFPNPFKSNTSIVYSLPENSDVEITLYDVTGREVQTLFKGHQIAGEHTLDIELKNIEAGVFFFKLEAVTYKAISKCIITQY